MHACRSTLEDPTVVPTVLPGRVTPRHYRRVQQATVRAYARAGRRDPATRQAVARYARATGLKPTSRQIADAYVTQLAKSNAPWRYTLPGLLARSRVATPTGTVRPRRKQSPVAKARESTIGAATGQFTRQLGAISPSSRLLAAPAQLFQAFTEDPLGVSGKTAKGLAEIAVATPAGIVEAVKNPTAIPGQVRKDLERRYGPLTKGNTEEFRKRIREEGAAPELVDALTVATAGGAIEGRALGAAARQGTLGKKLQRVASEERPRLRVAGNATREQELARNLFRALGQRGEDTARRRVEARRGRKAARRGQGAPALRSRDTAQVLLDANDRYWQGLRKAAAARDRGDRDGQREALAQAARAEREYKHAERASRRTGTRPEVTPLMPARAQRKEAARVQSRAYNAMRREQAEELDRGTRRALSKLTANERAGMWFAVQGLVDPANPGQAVQRLRLRAERIRANRRAEGLEGRSRELEAIESILRQPGKTFTPRLRKVAAREAARTRRLVEGDPAVQPATAAARRVRPLARELGIDRPYEQARELLDVRYRQLRRQAVEENWTARQVRDLEHDYRASRLELEARRPELDQRFVQQVIREAGGEFPEPGYVEHVPQHQANAPRRANRAIGGSKAMPGAQESRMRLFDLGEADVSPEQLVNSGARTIKRKHQWRMIAEQVDRHALPDPQPETVRRALGYDADPRNLSLHELRTVLDEQGVDLNDVGFWNPGVARAARRDVQDRDDPTGNLAEQETTAALGRAAVDGRLDEGQIPADVLQSRGWRVLTRTAHNELVGGVNPSGPAGRAFDKAMGVQSRLLLGLNPTWPMAQVAANLLQSSFGVRMNPAAYVRAQRFWRRMPDDLVKRVDDEFGTGIGTAHGRKTRLGAAAHSDWLRSLQARTEAAKFRASMGKQKIPGLRRVSGNPVDAMFQFDDAQNRFFRKTVLYSEAKREAYRQMQREGGAAYRLQNQIEDIFKARDPEDRMRKILENPELFDKHAEKVDEFLGNWTRFTVTERRTLKRMVLFYGFLRFAVRTAFYTLPVKHPVAASIAAKLGQLHVEEVKELLGGDEAPWAYSRIFFGKDGKLKSIDLARINPVTSPAVDAATEGPRALAGLASPVLQASVDQVYATKAFTGLPFRVGGSTAAADKGRFYPRVFTDQILSALFPYRLGERLTQEGTQGDDSLLFSERPVRYKRRDAIEREQRKRAREGTTGQELLEQLLPFFVPRPDYTRETVKGIQDRKGGKKRRRGGRSLGDEFDEFRREQSSGDPLLREFEDFKRGGR